MRKENYYLVLFTRALTNDQQSFVRYYNILLSQINNPEEDNLIQKDYKHRCLEKIIETIN